MIEKSPVNTTLAALSGKKHNLINLLFRLT